MHSSRDVTRDGDGERPHACRLLRRGPCCLHCSLYRPRVAALRSCHATPLLANPSRRKVWYGCPTSSSLAVIWAGSCHRESADEVRRSCPEAGLLGQAQGCATMSDVGPPATEEAHPRKLLRRAPRSCATCGNPPTWSQLQRPEHETATGIRSHG